MTNLELLDILGNVRGEYILQAQELRAGNAKNAIRKVSRKRMILLAAVIALLLLLVGCAAVLIGMQKIDLGHATFSAALSEPFERDVLSLSGYKGTPGYLATQEWLAFENNYDKDRSLMLNAENSGYEKPRDYFAYQCYTQEMQDKIDEICGKYGLKLTGPMYFPNGGEQALRAVEVLSIGNGEMAIQQGLYFHCGSFTVYGELRHRYADRQVVDTLSFRYDANKRDVFFPGYATTSDISALDAWEYTSPDGINLLLAQDGEAGLIVSDNGDCVISIKLYFPSGGSAGPDSPRSRKDLEQIADRFAYDIHPRPPKELWQVFPNTQFPAGYDPETAAVTAEENGRLSYDAHFENWLPGSGASEAYSPDYQQKFLDLDGDGSDEMLIRNTRTGVVYEVVTMVDGRTVCVYGGGQYGSDDHTAELYLRKGNILERRLANGASVQGRERHEFYRVQDRQMVMVECVLCGNDGKWYWSECGGASSVMWKEITQEEYDAVLAKYACLEDGPVTVDGYYFLTNEPVRVTVGVERVLRGEEAYRELLAQNAQCPPPEDGQEYILVTVNMTYEDGEADSILLYEERHASLGAARVLFNIPNKAGNSVDVTSYLANPIWGRSPLEGRPWARGETLSGDVAFLVEQGNTQPLYFWGYNQAVQFRIH